MKFVKEYVLIFRFHLQSVRHSVHSLLLSASVDRSPPSDESSAARFLRFLRPDEKDDFSEEEEEKNEPWSVLSRMMDECDDGGDDDCGEVLALHMVTSALEANFHAWFER